MGDLLEGMQRKGSFIGTMAYAQEDISSGATTGMCCLWELMMMCFVVIGLSDGLIDARQG